MIILKLKTSAVKYDKSLEKCFISLGFVIVIALNEKLLPATER